MFNVYVRDFNRNGQLVSSWELLQSVPALTEGDLKLISPIVKTDMGNAESLDFGIEPGTKYYDAFLQMKTFIRIDYGADVLDTIFYGRVLTITNSFYGSRKIRCEGPLAFFNDTSVEGVSEASRRAKTINEYLTDLINNHNSNVQDNKRTFVLGEVPGNYSTAVSEDQQISGTKRKYGSDSWTDTKSALEDLRSHHGGYYRARPVFNGSSVSVYLDWMNHYFNKNYNTQSIEVGKNVLDISISTEIDNIFTVVIPIGTTTTSSSSESGTKKSGNNKFYVDSKEIKVSDVVPYFVNKGQESKLNRGYHRKEDYAESVNKYGRIIKTVTFDDAKDKNDLYDKCCEWILNNYQGEVTKFQIKAVDMHQIGEKAQKILVGDRVRIIYPVGTEDGKTVKQDLYRTCLSISYDLYNPENNTYTFGIPANILTKTYGVTKQGKSTTGGSRPKGSNTSSEAQEREWFDLVVEWLRTHLIWYKTGNPQAPFPYTEQYANYMHGPYSSMNPNRIYTTSDDFSGWLGNYALWHPTKNGTHMDDTFDRNQYDILDRYSTADAEKYKTIHTIQDWYIGASPEDLGHSITLDDIRRCNIIEYVIDEYGFNLKTMLAVKMPSTIKLGDGTTVEYTQGVDAQGNEDLIETAINRPESGAHIIWSPDGREITAYKDEAGNWHYITFDKNGKRVETNFYSFEMETIENNRQHEFITKKYFKIPVIDPATGKPKIIGYDDEGNPIYEYEKDEKGNDKLEAYSYEFGQTVENYANGELVVARVDGDLVRLGGAHTSQVTTKALENISSVCGDFTVEVDPDTGEEKLIIKDGSGIYQSKNGMELGLYHDGNLTAGVVVDKINNGDTQTNITGDHIVIGTKDGSTISNTVRLMATNELEMGLYRVVNIPGQGAVPVLEAGNRIKRVKDGVTGYYGIWDSSGQEIDAGMVVEKINGQTTTYLRGDRVVVGNAQTNKSVLEALKTAKVITSDTLEPQALVTSAVYTAKINAVEGRISTLETDYLKTVYLTSEESALSKIYFKELWGNYIHSNSISSTNIYIRRGLTPYGSDDNWSIKNFIAYIQVIPDGDDYKLQYKDFDDEDWKDAGTFNRAATVQGDWSGGVYTVTPKIGKIKENINTRLNGIFAVNDSEPRKHNAFPKIIGQTQRVTYYAPNPAGTGELYIDTGFTQDVWINAELVYDDGYDIAKGYITYPTTEGTGSTIQINGPNNARTGSVKYVTYGLKNSDDNPNNKVVLYTTVNGENIPVARIIHNKWNSGYDTAKGYITYPTTEGTGSSIIINGPKADRSGSEKYVTYALANNGNNEMVLYTTVNGSNVNVAKFTHNKWNSGWNSGYDTAKGYITYPKTEGTGSTIQINGPKADRSGSEKYVSYALANNGNNEIVLYTSVNGSNVNVAKFTHNKWNSGYDTAKGYITYPTTTGTGSSIQINGPKADRSGSEKYVTYALANNGDNEIVLYTTVNGSNVNVAKFTHNKYTAGQKSITDNGIPAANWHPSTSVQTIAAGQYLSGAQTIKAVKFTNLSAGNIKNGVTIKVGDEDDMGRLKTITGTYSGGSTTFEFENSLIYRTSINTPQYRGDDDQMHNCELIKNVGTVADSDRSIRVCFRLNGELKGYYIAINR